VSRTPVKRWPNRFSKPNTDCTSPALVSASSPRPNFATPEHCRHPTLYLAAQYDSRAIEVGRMVVPSSRRTEIMPQDMMRSTAQSVALEGSLRQCVVIFKLGQSQHQRTTPHCRPAPRSPICSNKTSSPGRATGLALHVADRTKRPWLLRHSLVWKAGLLISVSYLELCAAISKEACLKAATNRALRSP
jgi:hypothetical protein